MAFSTFDAFVVVDPRTLAPVAGVAGTIADAATGSSIQVYDMNENPVPVLASNSKGYVGSFKTQGTVRRIEAKFGDYALVKTSAEAIAEAAALGDRVSVLENPQELANGSDLNTVQVNGWRFSRSVSNTATMTNRPPDAADSPFQVEVSTATVGNYVHTVQTYYTYSESFERRVWERNTVNALGTGWSDWRRMDNPAAMLSGAANPMLLQDFTRRRGPVHTNGRAAVAYRFDHGLANYRDEIKPLFDARWWKHSQALNSNQWGYAEMGGVTPAQVDGWVQEGLLEIWHHAENHSDATTVSLLEQRIVESLETLRSQIPSAVIDGFAPPGVGGSSYLGFNGGNSAEAFFETVAGRLILEHHAVSSGYIPDTAYHRPLDGVVRHGMGHLTADSLSAATLNDRVDIAIANGEGIQIMLHPSQINLTGKITTAEFEAHLNYVQQKVDEGVLVVLSPYELVLANRRNMEMIQLGDVDLNTLLVPGDYFQPASVNAGGGNNYPEGRAGDVMVRSNSTGSNVTQKYHSYGSTNRVWHRTYYSGTWYPWQSGDPQFDETAGRKITVRDPINGREQLIHYDSGWRDVSGLLTNGWTVGTDFRIRREGYTVTLRIHNLNGSAASTSAVWQLPSGFRPQGTTEVFLRSDEAGTVMKLMTIRWDGAIFMSTGTVTTNNGATEVSFATTAAAPSTLPGTAIGTIPYQ
ncbi:pyocin knob domain-containing protein [Zhihengliuella halotolerans]|uniref:Polysaccharide deacetylase n=1 Tax=Zhihengliuella halotolerans TaxID=370736 RepID=A0A4Q8AC27_9MICC|nr:pyocin knob domain-containing protein [Zhihengliuella halotolerans]RZU61732.1 hypothetical protein EV380_1310 [Zhihengliuella halotolerans]